MHDRAFREGNRKKQVIDMLIEHKADYHALTLRGEKALALAEARGFGLCAELLRKEYVVPIVEDAGKGDGDQDTPLAAALKEKTLF